MPNDAEVAISAGSGTNVDVSEITRNDTAQGSTGTVVERQRFVLGDDLGELLELNDGNLPVTDTELRDLARQQLSELRQIRFILSTWTGVQPIDLQGDGTWLT